MGASAKHKGIVKEGRKQLVTVLGLFAAVIAVAVTIFTSVYGSYNERVLYNERLSQMNSVTTELFSSLDNIVDTEWKTTAVQINYLVDNDPNSVDELAAFMKTQYHLSGFANEETELIAVDSNGSYYTQDGKKGSFAAMQSLLSNPDRISTVTNAMMGNETDMLFLERLENPVVLDTSNGTVKLLYYGISRNMTTLEPYFDCKAYEGNSCVYVVDDTGTKIFSSSSSSSSSNNNNSLVKGHNVFKALGQMEYLHGSSFDETMSVLSTDGVAYSNAVLDGEEYYYALNKMESADWTLVFLVPAKYVATNTVSLVNTTTHFVLFFAVGLVGVCAAIVIVVMSSRQRQVLEAQRRNAEALAVVNSELDAKNEQLVVAVREAEMAKRSAEKSNHAKSDFLANMSHDIRTPMNAIVGITDLMEHEGPGSDRLEDYIHKIKLSSHHLLSLINDILDMSKIESDKVDLQVVPVSMAEQVDQVDTIIRGQALERHQSFEIHTSNLVHEFLLTDGVRLRQIWLNLLGNAVKYTPDGGSVVFNIKELACPVADKARFIFEVTDTGIGMSEDYLPHVFEPFSRAVGSGTNKVQGTGLGMAITKNVVTLMGGTINVKSTLGEGTTFTVVLDLAIDPAPVCNVGLEDVVLVCDEERLAHNVAGRCQEASIKLACCKTVGEALPLLEQKSAQAVLYRADINSPSLAAEVRELRAAGRDDMLVFIIDYAQRESVVGLIVAAGADDLISRPFFVSSLEAAVRRVRGHAGDTAVHVSALNGKRFLCAEDNGLNVEILEALLEMYGATAEFCCDGEAIVERFETVRDGEFDAVLMDIQMPKMDGCAATEAIRHGSNPLGATIPIIAMTANAFSEDVQRSLHAGMNAHISKPVDIALLEKTMEKLAE